MTPVSFLPSYSVFKSNRIQGLRRVFGTFVSKREHRKEQNPAGMSSTWRLWNDKTTE